MIYSFNFIPNDGINIWKMQIICRWDEKYTVLAILLPYLPYSSISSTTVAFYAIVRDYKYPLSRVYFALK